MHAHPCRLLHLASNLPSLLLLSCNRTPPRLPPQPAASSHRAETVMEAVQRVEGLTSRPTADAAELAAALEGAGSSSGGGGGMEAQRGQQAEQQQEATPGNVAGGRQPLLLPPPPPAGAQAGSVPWGAAEAPTSGWRAGLGAGVKALLGGCVPCPALLACTACTACTRGKPASSPPSACLQSRSKSCASTTRWQKSPLTWALTSARRCPATSVAQQAQQAQQAAAPPAQVRSAVRPRLH